MSTPTPRLSSPPFHTLVNCVLGLPSPTYGVKLARGDMAAPARRRGGGARGVVRFELADYRRGEKMEKLATSKLPSPQILHVSC